MISKLPVQRTNVAFGDVDGVFFVISDASEERLNLGVRQAIRLAQQRGIQGSGDSFQSNITFNIESPLAGNVQLPAILPRSQLNFVLAVACGFRAPKDFLEICIRHEQWLGPVIEQEAEKRVETLELSKVNLAQPEEGPPSRVDL